MDQKRHRNKYPCFMFCLPSINNSRRTLEECIIAFKRIMLSMSRSKYVSYFFMGDTKVSQDTPVLREEYDMQNKTRDARNVKKRPWN